MNRSKSYLDELEDEDSSPLSARTFKKQQRAKSGDRQRQRGPARPRDEIAELAALEQGHSITYQPARYEAVWLQSSLEQFFSDGLIVDVLAQVKGGKEASVYRCQPHPSSGQPLVAAKVYRPRMFRNLRNDKLYRDGRPVLTSDGRAVKQTDDRLMRAIGKKTEFGAQVLHTSWLMYEYTTLERLFAAGASVPEPIAAAENAILMSYHGDEQRAAPTLSEVSLDRQEAVALFAHIMDNVELLLRHGLVHGDLSAYNILYWQGQITLIDFPQVISVEGNEHAKTIFQRDVARVCDHFRRYGVAASAEQIAAELWERYGVERELLPEVPEFLPEE